MRPASALEQLITKIEEVEAEAKSTAQAFQDTLFQGHAIFKAWEKLVEARLWLEEAERTDE